MSAALLALALVLLGLYVLRPGRESPDESETVQRHSIEHTSPRTVQRYGTPAPPQKEPPEAVQPIRSVADAHLALAEASGMLAIRCFVGRELDGTYRDGRFSAVVEDGWWSSTVHESQKTQKVTEWGYADGEYREIQIGQVVWDAARHATQATCRLVEPVRISLQVIMPPDPVLMTSGCDAKGDPGTGTLEIDAHEMPCTLFMVARCEEGGCVHTAKVTPGMKQVELIPQPRRKEHQDAEPRQPNVGTSIVQEQIEMLEIIEGVLDDADGEAADFLAELARSRMAIIEMFDRSKVRSDNDEE